MTEEPASSPGALAALHMREAEAWDAFRAACGRFASGLQRLHEARLDHMAALNALAVLRQQDAAPEGPGDGAAPKRRAAAAARLPQVFPPVLAPGGVGFKLPDGFEPTKTLTEDRARLMVELWDRDDVPTAEIFRRMNALPGPGISNPGNLTWYAEKLGLPTSRNRRRGPAPRPRPPAVSAPNLAQAAEPPPAPVQALVPPPPPPPPPPPVATLDPPEDEPGPEIVDQKLLKAQQKALRMLGDGTDENIVATHTSLPLREVFRLKGELRQQRRAGTA